MISNSEKIFEQILECVKKQTMDQEVAFQVLSALNKEEKNQQDVAIIGISCRFPNADNADEYWKLLLNGVNCISDFPKERRKDIDQFLFHSNSKPSYSQGSYLERVDYFDSEYFRIPPKEAEYMDPHQRIMLEVTAEAIEDAGYMGAKIYGSNTGVFIGRDHFNSATYQKFVDPSDGMTMTGNLPSILAGRIAHFFDFSGPNVVIDTACSSGFVALYQACESLKQRDCKMAVVGGICLNMMPLANSVFQIVENSAGQVRPFDQNAKGTLWGEGAAAVVIKPLDEAVNDKDEIYGVIKGMAVNSDGASTNLTTPSQKAQELLYMDAWGKADIDPESITYFETHGTGTYVGDPIEFKSLTQALSRYTNKRQFCGLGSVKSNIGHLVGASGMASLLKVLLSMKYKCLAPSIHFTSPNSYINFTDSPFYYVDTPMAWVPENTPRRAGISTFGFSGMNCHAVIEEYQNDTGKEIKDEPVVLTLSAKTKSSLLEMVKRFSEFCVLQPDVNLEDMMYTLNTGREHFSHRLAIIADSFKELQKKMSQISKEGFDSMNSDIGYYNEVKTFATGKNNIQNELAQQKQYGHVNEKAKEILIQINSDTIHGNARKQLYYDLAASYVQGARIPWEAFYEGKEVKTIHLPVYAFMKARHWPGMNHSNYMIGDSILSTVGIRVFERAFSMDADWLLNQHRILKKGMLPETAYLAMAKEASRYYTKEEGITLYNVVLHSPLELEDGEAAVVHTILKEQGDHLNFTIASKKIEETEKYTIHAEGEIRLNTKQEVPCMDIRQLITGKEEKNREGFKRILDGFIKYGPQWDCIQNIYENDNSAVLHIHCKNVDTAYDIQPSALDAALSFWHLYNNIDKTESLIYLPFYYETFTIYQSMPARLYSHVKKGDQKKDNQETVSYDITLYDESGKTFAEVTNYTLKRVHALSALSNVINSKDQEVSIGDYSSEEKSSRSNRDYSAGREGLQVTVIGKDIEKLSETEHKLITAWAEAFGLKEVDIHKDFYELGGDSILATQMTNIINKYLNINIDITKIFQNPSVEELAEYVGKLIGIGEASVIEPEEERKQEEIYDLTKSQYRIWFMQNYDREMTAYNVPVVKHLNQFVDIDIMQQAIDILVKSHASLRTVFKTIEGVPKQIVLPDKRVNINFIDFSEEVNKEKLWEKRIEELDSLPFYLEEGLFKVEVHRLFEEDYRFYLNIHHIISDGWSMGVLLQDLLSTYDQLRQKREVCLSPGNVQYVDLVKQEKQWLLSKECRTMEDYWQQELVKPLPELNLPVDYERLNFLSYEGTCQKFCLGEEVTEKLQKISKNNAVTLYMTVLSCYLLFLYRITQEEDIIVGFPVSGRDNKELEHVIGLFMNMTCIRVSFKEIHSFQELLAVVKLKCLNAYRNSKYPFNKLVEVINPKRDQSKTPIFSTIFQLYDNVPQDNAHISLYDLSCICKLNQERIEVRMEYKTTLFENETIAQYIKYFNHLIHQVIEDPGKDMRFLQLLNQSEWNSYMENLQSEIKIDAAAERMEEIFEACVRNHPEKTAVVFEERSLTYWELDMMSNELASYICERQIDIEIPIGIYMERSIELIVSILGVLKSGHAYIPLDVEFPMERIEYMITHSKLTMILTDKKNKLILGEFGLNQLASIIDVSSDEMRNQRISCKQAGGKKSDIMYIIYTSGSTGMPKGVAVTHPNAVNYIVWSREQFALSTHHNMMLVTSISFDISVFEIFGSLSCGAALYIVPKNTLKDSNLLYQYVLKNKVNVWHSVPTLMSQFLMVLRRKKDNGITCMRNFYTVLLGGEAWNYKLAKDVLEYFPNADLYNMYGPTEATIWITAHYVKECIAGKKTVCLGKPIANNIIYILDKHQVPCGPGIHGEICISGENVTPGYYKDEAKTNLVYRHHDFETRLVYHTGDIGKINNDFKIEYLGRNDGMVKVRGYRIEIGEIEFWAASVSGVDIAVVVAVEEDTTNNLICYFTANRDISESEFREKLSLNLPQYMLPSHFIRVKEMPMTLNNKIDKKELKKIKITSQNNDEIKEKETVNDTQKFILAIWRELLGMEHIGIGENFFDIGGNSNLITRMQFKIDEKYPDKVQIIDLFELKTIKQIAFHIDTKSEKNEEPIEDHSDEEAQIESILNLLDNYSSGNVPIEEALKKL